MRQAVDRLAGKATADVEALTERWEAGELADHELALAVAAVVARADSRALALGALAVAADLTRATGQAVAPVGVSLAAGTGERLQQAVMTVLQQPESAPTRLARLADNEPRERAQEARGEAIKRSPRAEGWRRQSSGKGCPACRELAGRGTVLSPSTPMWRHTGCSCQQVPTTRGETP